LRLGADALCGLTCDRASWEQGLPGVECDGWQVRDGRNGIKLRGFVNGRLVDSLFADDDLIGTASVHHHATSWVGSGYPH
jgi:hypothetical protein